MSGITHIRYTLSPVKKLSHFLRPLPFCSVTYSMDGPLYRFTWLIYFDRIAYLTKLGIYIGLI